MRYLFFLGREEDIALAELRAVLFRLGKKHTLMKYGRHTLVEADDLPTDRLMQILGGIVKIASEVTEEGTPEETIIATLLNHPRETKISFGVTGEGIPSRLAITIKKTVAAAGKSVRAVDIKNSASILHNHLLLSGTDFTIFQGKVFRTVALQPFEAFGERDFGRPESDAKSGMLPPKLARQMINLAGTTEESTFLDPFCGSGTTLVEALDLGIKRVFGSDISDKAVHDSQVNTAWITEKKHLDPQPVCTVFQADARAIVDHLGAETIDAIATEPFLGEPLRGHETEKDLQKQAQELRMLYLESLRTMGKVLLPHGKICIVFPEFIHRKGVIRSLTDTEITKTGFSLLELLPGKTSLLYHRRDQHVGRRLYVLQKKNSA